MRYHYLSSDLNSSAQCYGLYDGNTIIGFVAILHFPHSKNKKIKRIHRIVIHPDYQGIGLGIKFLNCVSQMYRSEGYDVTICTSSFNLMKGLLHRKDQWVCVRHNCNTGLSATSSIPALNRTARHVKTASFYMK